LRWARELQAIAQTGLAYDPNVYDRERYEAVARVAVELLAAGSGAPVETVARLFVREGGYATPKVDVRGVVFLGDALLLVRERSDGLWTLPGGWADVNETPSEAVEREVREESGYSTRATKLLAAYDRDAQGHPPMQYSVYKLLFLCEPLGDPEPLTGHEVGEVGFYREGEEPPLSLSRVTPAQLRRVWEHRRRPDLPADFD
jgi:ADP-ribose pyrophosphatase YjhB (NUDIX family)